MIFKHLLQRGCFLLMREPPIIVICFFIKKFLTTRIVNRLFTCSENVMDRVRIEFIYLPS